MFFMRKNMSKAVFLLASLLFSVLLMVSHVGTARAQENPSGALDFGIQYERSMNARNVLGIHARAMAVDRVPGKMIGRFAEAYLSLGVGLKGDLIQYGAGLKFGVGLGVPYVVFFIASGLMVDSYTSIDEQADADNVKPGLGLPILIGLWVDPLPNLYLYVMAEPSWAFWGDGRATDPFIPFSFARELRLRGGIGFDISKLHVRIDYTFHQVAPYSWHTISLGFGMAAGYMATLGD